MFQLRGYFDFFWRKEYDETSQEEMLRVGFNSILTKKISVWM